MPKSEKINETKYTAAMKYSAETIRVLTGVQYNTFFFGRKLIQLIISLILFAAGIKFSSSTSGIIMLAAGCMLIVSLDYRPKMMAKQLCAQYNGNYPTLSYCFSNKGVTTQNVSTETPYSSFIRLIDSNNYLYIFVNQVLVYMVDKSSIEGADGSEGFKKFLSETTKCEWKKPFSLLTLNLTTIKELINTNSHKKGFTGERLGNRKH